VGRLESQLQSERASMQLYSMPHWQVWTLARLPAMTSTLRMESGI
jgi:hypothetical protein